MALYKMNQVKGLLDFQFSIGSNERGLWFDSDKRDYQPSALLGFKFSLNFGEIMRPIPKFWKFQWRGWRRLPGNWPNPWTSTEYWFVFRSYIPLIMPFLSISIKRFGIYLGCKIYDITRERHLERYKNWLQEFPKEEGWTKLCPSFTLRSTRWT